MMNHNNRVRNLKEEKMRKGMVVLSLVLVSAAVAFPAQKSSKVSLNLGGGLALPLNSGLSENYKAAIHLGGTVNIAIKSGFSIFIDGRFHSLGIKAGAYGFPDKAALTGGSATILSIIGGVKYTLPLSGSVHFYAFAGAGFNAQSYSDVTAKWTTVTPYYSQTNSWTKSFDSDAGLGILVGPGILVDLGPSFALFSELRYASCLGKNMYLPIVLGIQIKL